MRFLCWFGGHSWVYQFVGSSWQPNDYVRRCWRCGVEHPRGTADREVDTP